MEQASDKIIGRKRTNMSPTPELGPRFGINQMAGRGETIRRPGDIPDRPSRVGEVPPLPPKKHLIGRLALILTTIIGGGGSAMLGAQHHANYEEPLNPSGIVRDVSSIPGGWWDLGKSQVTNIMERLGKFSIGETFDNTAQHQMVQAGRNATPVPSENFDSLITNSIKRAAEGKNSLPEMTLLFPAILQPGDKAEVITTYSTHNTEVNIATGERTILPQRVAYKEFMIPRKGTQLTSGIIDREAVETEVFLEPPLIIDGESHFRGLRIFVTRRDGSRYEVQILSPQDIRSLRPLPTIQDAPVRETELVREGDHNIIRVKNPSQKGKVIDLQTPILETGLPDAGVLYGIRDLSPENPLGAFSRVDLATNAEDQVIYRSS